MIFCAYSTADHADRQGTLGINGLWNHAGFLHSFDRNEMLTAMIAVAAYEQTSVLPARVLAAANHPVLLKLTFWAWIVRPLKRFWHYHF